MLPILAARAPKTPMDWYIFLAIVAGVAAIAALAWWWDRSRRKSIATLLRAIGFEVDERDSSPFTTKSAKVAGLVQTCPEYIFFTGNPLIKYERSAVCWSAVGEYAGHVVRLLEYKYTTGHGKGRQDHYHLVAATDLPVSLPDFTLERSRWFMSHRPSLKPTPIAFADGAFAKAFTLYGLTDAGARALATP